MPEASAAARLLREEGGGRQARFVVLFAALCLAAWAALGLLAASPYARYLQHGGWIDGTALAAWCRAIPQGTIVVPALFHALAWVLMIAAMMLPTAAPLLALFRRIVSDRPEANRLLALATLGFFVAWMGFGLVAHAADELLHSWAAADPRLVANGWIVGAAVLAAAGLFQWSALKYRCLEQCRTPFGFVTSRWHGRAPSREAFRIGLDHGLFCVGCCWALMLVMFVVGTGSFGWMLALAAAMAAEKNLPWGRHLRTPVGVALLAGAGAVVAANI